MNDIEQTRFNIINALINQGVNDSNILKHHTEALVEYIFSPWKGEALPSPHEGNQNKD